MRNVVKSPVARSIAYLGWCAIAVTFLLAFCTLQLRPDERLTSSLSAGSEPAADTGEIGGNAGVGGDTGAGEISGAGGDAGARTAGGKCGARKRL